MKIGNLGQLTLVNGDLHFELDVNIAGTAQAPLTADIQLGQLLQMLQANVTNNLEKMALTLIISMLNTVNIQAAQPDAEKAVPPWLLQLLEQIVPSLIQIIVGALGHAGKPYTEAQLKVVLAGKALEL